MTTLLDQLASGQAPPLLALTVDQLHALLAGGQLSDAEPVELVEGLLVHKDRSARGEDRMTHGKRHSSAVAMLRRIDRRLDVHGCHLRTQLPVTLSATTELEPDGAIVTGSDDAYLDRHPGPADVLAVIEVADSSLSFDRGTKLRLYATAAIPAYVIVNLADRRVELYLEPDRSEGTYRVRRDISPGELVELPIAGSVLTVQASDFVPG